MENSEQDPLKCQVHGCNARWTINMGWKKCSKHAWSNNADVEKNIKKTFDQPPVRPFYEVDDDGVF